MVQKLGVVGLIWLTSFVLADQGIPVLPFVIDGQYILDGEGTDAKTPDNGSHYVRVVVSRNIIDQEGNADNKVLATGIFLDNRVVLKGVVLQPTEIKITAYLDQDRKVDTDALIVPDGDKVSFAVIDRKDPELDQLLLVGASRRASDPKKKFLIFQEYKPKSSGANQPIRWVTVTAEEFAPDGSLREIEFGTVMIQDNKYLIEAEVVEPRVAKLSVYRGSDYEYPISGTYVVIEPGARISFGQHGPEEGFTFPTAEWGRHAKLLDSWRTSDEYLNTLHAYNEAQDRHFGNRDPHAVLKEQREQAEAESSEESDNQLSTAEVPNTSEDSAKATEAVLAIEPSPAEGCEHVASEEVIPGYQGFDPDAPKPAPKYEYQRTWQRVSEIQSASLRNFAWNSEDPFDSLVALELGRKYWSWGDVEQSDILRLYDKLATVHDDDVVARRIKPARDQLAGSLDRLANNKRLEPGQKAPVFTLATLDDEEISLEDVLEGNELVLVDFWASWCGPCIAAFPTYKKMHKDFSEHGFEVVSISIDDAFEDWEESSKEHELPWFDVGEMKGYDGIAAIEYGVTFLPKTYLIDSSGCILQKDIEHEQYEEFVSARLSKDSTIQ